MHSTWTVCLVQTRPYTSLYSLSLSVSLSLCFNGNFPGELGLAGTRMSPFWILLKHDNGGNSDNWSYKKCKAQTKLSPSTNQHPVFYRPDAAPDANQQCQSTEGNILGASILYHNDFYLPVFLNFVSWVKEKAFSLQEIQSNNFQRFSSEDIQHTAFIQCGSATVDSLKTRIMLVVLVNIPHFEPFSAQCSFCWAT